ncbi:hypothetical protein KAS14_06390 [Candidatus Bathyarchaeota archaeon]|nr:hypothetical protein [Candidatus Bathyarchaeota archaeon]
MEQISLKLEISERYESGYIDETVKELEKLRNEIDIKRYLRWLGSLA